MYNENVYKPGGGLVTRSGLSFGISVLPKIETPFRHNQEIAKYSPMTNLVEMHAYLLVLNLLEIYIGVQIIL